jgi:hypothetical protein
MDLHPGKRRLLAVHHHPVLAMTTAAVSILLMRASVIFFGTDLRAELFLGSPCSHHSIDLGGLLFYFSKMMTKTYLLHF